MSDQADIVERLQAINVDDHDRGCPGRMHACACGYDDQTRAAVEAAAAEIKRLNALLDKRWRDARLLRAAPDGKGAFQFAIETDLAGLMAEHLLQIMQADGGTNFVQMEVEHPEVGPLTFTIEKRLGRAPAVQLAEAKERVAQLEAALQLARKWGVSSRNWSGTVAVDLADWIDGGMDGKAPVEPIPERLSTRGRTPPTR